MPPFQGSGDGGLHGCQGVARFGSAQGRPGLWDFGPSGFKSTGFQPVGHGQDARATVRNAGHGDPAYNSSADGVGLASVRRQARGAEKVPGPFPFQSMIGMKPSSLRMRAAVAPGMQTGPQLQTN